MDLPRGGAERPGARQRHRHRRYADDAGADEHLCRASARISTPGTWPTAWCARSPGHRAGCRNCSARRCWSNDCSIPRNGSTSATSLSSVDPRQGGIGNMVNCGAAMYIAPIGAVNAGDPKAAYDEAIAFAVGPPAELWARSGGRDGGGGGRGVRAGHRRSTRSSKPRLRSPRTARARPLPTSQRRRGSSRQRAASMLR